MGLLPSLLTVVLTSLAIEARHIVQRQASTCSRSSPENTFPSSFSLLALDPSKNATLTLAPVPNISFDEPGTLYLGGSTDVTFTLSNYTLSTGTAPCTLDPFGSSDGLGIIKCVQKPAARNPGGNPYFTVGCHETLNILVLQAAFESASGSFSTCDNFSTDFWANFGEAYINLVTCGQVPAGQDALVVQVIPVTSS